MRILREVDYIAAEDTRHSKKLLQHFAIETKMLALHEHNERQKITQIVKDLQQGKNIALISDAGTPLMSDPGYHLVQAAARQQLPIVPIPGACAAIAALCVAGLPSDRFAFEGFLPVKSAARQRYLQALQTDPRTLIFYEAPHRIVEMLTDLQHIFGGQRPTVIARELTKTFETIYRGYLADLITQLQQNPQQICGEFVVLVQGVEKQTPSSNINPEKILTLLLAELPLKQAVILATKITQQRKNDLYQLALRLRSKFNRVMNGYKKCK